jgi:translation initiation factor IF-3
MKHAREWLQEGDKVKATIWFRGREMTHRELGSRILAKLESDLQDIGEVEARPRMEGNQMFIIFGPKRHKGAAKPDRPTPAPTASPVAERPAAEPAAPDGAGLPAGE